MEANDSRNDFINNHLRKKEMEDALENREINTSGQFVNYSRCRCSFLEVIKAKTSPIGDDDAHLLRGIYFTDNINIINKLFSELEKCGIKFPESLMDQISGQIAFVPVAFYGNKNYPINPVTMRNHILQNKYPKDPLKRDILNYDYFCCKPDHDLFRRVKAITDKFGPYYEKFFNNLFEARRGVYINRI